jgi:hypothetical protein
MPLWTRAVQDDHSSSPPTCRIPVSLQHDSRPWCHISAPASRVRLCPGPTPRYRAGPREYRSLLGIVRSTKRVAPWEVTRPSDNRGRNNSTVLPSTSTPQFVRTSYTTSASWSFKASLNVLKPTRCQDPGVLCQIERRDEPRRLERRLDGSGKQNDAAGARLVVAAS